MYINKRQFNKNHIPYKLNYKYKNNNKNKQFKQNNNNKNDEYNDYLDEQLFYENALLLFEPTILSNDIEFKLFNQTAQEETFQEKFERLDQQPLEFFEIKDFDVDNLYLIRNFLYHGIRSYNSLEKLEGIFKDKVILAGNYQKDSYYSYDDNCNNGEYISLANIDNDYNLTYQTFVMPNISLVISPECKAIKTIYINYDEWEKIKDLDTFNRYSYANNEYQVKESISFDYVKAIGFPKEYLRRTNQENKFEEYFNCVFELMKKYNLDLPIVDTSNYNRILYQPKNYKLERKKYFTK